MTHVLLLRMLQSDYVYRLYGRCTVFYTDGFLRNKVADNLNAFIAENIPAKVYLLPGK